MSELRKTAIGLLALALTACAVGPDFVRPRPPSQEAFARGPEVAGKATQAGDALHMQTGDGEFWRGFGDAQLSELVEAALLSNHDLRSALARYDRANALLRGTRLDRLPTVTTGAEVANSRASADQALALGGGGRDATSYSAGVNATWELDLFGRIRRNIEADSAEALASGSDLQAAQVAIVGEVALTYVELRGAQERLRLARGNAENQRETLNLVEQRLQAGRGTEADVARARAQLESTLARAPALDAQVAFAMHRLAVLCGRTPESLIAELTPQRPLPALPGKLDPGTPGELLRRRPDVAAAEARLHSANARIGAATADLFPRFTLAGLIGSQALDRSALFERGSETRLLSFGVDWSFLNVGRVRARIKSADADAEGALARYEQTVLLALEDTENALVRYARARTEDDHLGRAASDSASAARLARVRFDEGSVDLLDLLDAERTLLQAQDALADARTRSVSGAIRLYEAMAGGWPSALPMREAAVHR